MRGCWPSVFRRAEQLAAKKGEEKSDNTTNNDGRGNSRAYTLDRLDRDEHADALLKRKPGSDWATSCDRER